MNQGQKYKATHMHVGTQSYIYNSSSITHVPVSGIQVRMDNEPECHDK
jgi:hypothetical protein